MSTQERLEGRATVSRVVELDGVGLHTGARTWLRIGPAPPGRGRVLVCSGQSFPATWAHVLRTERSVSLGCPGVEVSTVEHLMAALYALDIDDVRLELSGPELPALDGSAAGFLSALQSAQRRPRRLARRRLRVARPVELLDGPRRARWSPTAEPGLELDVRVAFPHYGLREQRWSGRIDPKVFAEALAPARTFGFLSELDALERRGLALGASVDNALLLGPEGPVWPQVLRFPDEPVRHKALDAIGDLALLGAPIDGRLELVRAGHAFHLAALRALLNTPGAWAWQVL